MVNLGLVSYFFIAMALNFCHGGKNGDFPGATRRDFLGRIYYFFRSPELTWKGAQASCQQYGGNLASAFTPDVVYFFIQIANEEKSSFWTGGNRLGRNDLNFKWVENGKFIGQLPGWLHDQPDNYQESPEGEQCIQMYTEGPHHTGLNDMHCDLRNPYLCTPAQPVVGGQAGVDSSFNWLVVTSFIFIISQFQHPPINFKLNC